MISELIPSPLPLFGHFIPIQKGELQRGKLRHLVFFLKNDFWFFLDIGTQKTGNRDYSRVGGKYLDINGTALFPKDIQMPEKA